MIPLKTVRGQIRNHLVLQSKFKIHAWQLANIMFYVKISYPPLYKKKQISSNIMQATSKLDVTSQKMRQRFLLAMHDDTLVEEKYQDMGR